LRQFPHQRVLTAAGTDHQKSHRGGIESANGRRGKEIFGGEKKLRQCRLGRFTGFLSAPAQFASEDGLSLQ